ncbi:hypothetical protein [Raoultibacter phocaeensis]|uniref:hypothetical protein n=1 Tax=Raoultibacter phocaeensis TaxID=2479841 RepID=UPI0015D5A91A|nr:hypothetical protein [Raoultibacter phocaeensis]
MQIPVDIKAVIDEATNIDEARATPISVSIYMDETAPGDVQAHVRQAFASASVHARVSTVYFPSFPVVAAAGSDMAVIVAGLDEHVGKYASEIRAAGVPVMVVTTLPDLAAEIAAESGYPLLEDDTVAPSIDDVLALPAEANGKAEPYPLTVDGAASLNMRMGEWVIEACRDKRLAFALAFRFVRKPLSLEAVSATAAQNAGIGLVVFIPGADMPIMTLNQAKMLLQIAAAYGQPMEIARVKELAAVVGGAFACRAVARQLIAFVPALGWAIKAAIGYTGTLAMGRAAIEYFEGDGKIDHLAEVVGRARDKAVMAADSARKQPSMKAAAKSAVSKVGKAASGAASRVVPTAASVANSAVDAVASSGVVPKPAAQAASDVAGRLTDTVVHRFKKGARA